MALTVNTGTTTTASTTGTSVDLTFPASTPTAGNLLVGAGTEFSTSPAVTITDNQSGNTYSDSGVGFVHNGSQAVTMFYAKNINVSGTYTIHFTSIPSGATGSFFVYEVAGADTSSPSESNASANAATVSSSSVTSNSISNTSADAIYFACEANSGNTAGRPLATGSFTMDNTNGRQSDGSNFEQGGLAYQIVSTVSSRAATFTVGSSGTAELIIMTFKQAAAGGFDPTTVPNLASSHALPLIPTPIGY